MKKAIHVSLTKEQYEKFIKNRQKVIELLKEIIEKDVPVRRHFDLDIYDVRTVLYVDAQLYEKVQEYAEKHKIKKSVLIRELTRLIG